MLVKLVGLALLVFFFFFFFHMIDTGTVSAFLIPCTNLLILCDILFLHCFLPSSTISSFFFFFFLFALWSRFHEAILRFRVVFVEKCIWVSESKSTVIGVIFLITR